MSEDNNNNNKNNKVEPSIISSMSTHKKNKYNRDYWKEEEERILRDWADKAQCYELMHSKSHEVYNYRNTLFVIPVIIISTITGTANFAQDRVPEAQQSIFVMVVGAFNIIAAIISTIAQYLKISELNESHRVGTLQWGKFYRNIRTELAKHPLDRVPPTNMLSMCKEEFDRLLEIYPDIPQKIVNEFKIKFNNIDGISKPEICDAIEPTEIYPITADERLSMIRRINNIPATPEESSENEIKLNNESDDEETNEQKENREKMYKFKQTFFKINNRYPTEDEIKESINFTSSNTGNEINGYLDSQV